MSLKYQIFVSSTYLDLVTERDQVVKAILEMGHIPVGMEMFSAADETQWQTIAKTIDTCDYYVVIVAHRYGSMDGAVSFTEKEYDYAISISVPTLGFIIDDATPWPRDRMEDEESKRQALAAFKVKLKKKLVTIWKASEDLYSKVPVALMKQMTVTPRPGWVRGNTVAKSSSPSAKEFFKRNDYPPDLKLLLNNSKTAVFWGTAFTKFISHLRDDVESRLTQGLEIRFLLIKPDGAALGMANLRGRPEDISHRKTDLERNLAILKSLASKAPPGKLERRVLDYLAPYTMVAFDAELQTGRMFVWLATLGVPNTERPMFELTKKNDPEWFGFFTQQFDLTWNEAVEP